MDGTLPSHSIDVVPIIAAIVGLHPLFDEFLSFNDERSVIRPLSGFAHWHILEVVPSKVSLSVCQEQKQVVCQIVCLLCSMRRLSLSCRLACGIVKFLGCQKGQPIREEYLAFQII